jgi:deazaflavin-dependent oxidoreductase (nitroreductase family)
MGMDWNAWNRGVIDEFRANGGKVGDQFEGKPMAVVTTTGAKTGAKRENPLVRLDDGGKVYVIASKGGAPDNPDWYYNMMANPEVTVELGTETFTARATVVEDEAERRRLYDKMIAQFESFAEYEKSTTRRIPVVELART